MATIEILYAELADVKSTLKDTLATLKATQDRLDEAIEEALPERTRRMIAAALVAARHQANALQALARIAQSA